MEGHCEKSESESFTYLSIKPKLTKPQHKQKYKILWNR